MLLVSRQRSDTSHENGAVRRRGGDGRRDGTAMYNLERSLLSMGMYVKSSLGGGAESGDYHVDGSTLNGYGLDYGLSSLLYLVLTLTHICVST